MPSAIVVGDPHPRSTAFRAAAALVGVITGRPADIEIDLARCGPALFGPLDEGDAIRNLRGANLVVVASPLVNGSYSGLLKLFLDRVPAGTLSRATAIPLIVGRSPRHALAGEIFLKPVLAELGALTSSGGVFLLESQSADRTVIEEWYARERRRLPTRLALLGVS